MITKYHLQKTNQQKKTNTDIFMHTALIMSLYVCFTINVCKCLSYILIKLVVNRKDFCHEYNQMQKKAADFSTTFFDEIINL